MQVYAKTQTKEDPHSSITDHAGLAAHQDRYLSLAKDKFNWQVVTCFALLLATVLAGAIAYMYGQRKEYVFFVQGDDLGIARYVKALPAEPLRHPYVLQAQVMRFIKDIRPITTDRNAFANQLNDAYAICLKDAQTYIKTYYDQVKPLDLIQKGISIYPQKIKAVMTSPTQYRVYWEEETQQQGVVTARTHWEATITLELVHPGDLTTEQQQRSPLGIWIKDVSWFQNN